MRRREFITLFGGAEVFVPQERRWSQAASINLTRFEKAAEVAAKRIEAALMGANNDRAGESRREDNLGPAFKLCLYGRLRAALFQR